MPEPSSADSGKLKSSRKRILIVGRRFWPHGGHAEAVHLTELASGLHRLGYHVEVVTPRYASHWPERFQFREFAVHRPVAAPKSDWSVARYTRQLTQWLRTKCRSFDAIIVDCIREEAIAAIEATRRTACQTILKFGSRDGVSDDQWWNQNRASRRCAAIGRMADHVIVTNANQSRSLLTHHFDVARIKRIENGFRSGPVQNAVGKAAARKSLGQVNGDLLTDSDSIVLLTTDRMTRGGGVFTLVEAARLLMTKHPNLRIWFIGDGPARDKIYSTLRSDGIRAQIAMPGSFCDFDDLMMAADVYIHSGDDGGASLLPIAIASGLPIVARSSPANYEILGAASADQCPEIAWYDSDKEYDLRKKISHLLRDRTASLQASEILKRRLLRSRPESRMLEQYDELIQQQNPTTTQTTKPDANRKATG
ncbi:Glycosyl transferases group 1 [Rubripirellula obstinata]|uniref:Glycosyl transferases group 1 n=1 Tax=Rubripirellula obstinata TaxID=406547 RepID=A0A5B1CFJ1_9BACT|nr:glycosyltransferase family 4 protein [Rubripirellula obstinata]KAA1259306.1 Glycosyl transferases group 1 [Rubripirellula obstinata]